MVHLSASEHYVSPPPASASGPPMQHALSNKCRIIYPSVMMNRHLPYVYVILNTRKTCAKYLNAHFARQRMLCIPLVLYVPGGQPTGGDEGETRADFSLTRTKKDLVEIYSATHFPVRP